MHDMIYYNQLDLHLVGKLPPCFRISNQNKRGLIVDASREKKCHKFGK